MSWFMSLIRNPQTFIFNGDPLTIIQVDLQTPGPRQTVKVTYRGASVHYSLEVDSWEIARESLNRSELANFFHRASDLSLAARTHLLGTTNPAQVYLDIPSGFSDG